MTTIKKFSFAALGALTVALATASTFSAAEAAPRRWHHRPHWGAGAALVGGLAIAGAIAASSAYAAEDAGPVRRCYLVDRVNAWGDVIGTRRVCRTEY